MDGLINFLHQSGVDLTECVDGPEGLDTAQRLFERQIKFWSCRPMPEHPASAVCPADARVIVGCIVERKHSTFTIGGASFVGIVLLPWIIQAFNNFAAEPSGFLVPAKPMLAAMAIAYSFGEAFGRLACISFGCCYGKQLWQAPIPLQKMLRNFCFTFSGETKKVAYEANLLERPLIPIQAATAIISVLAGMFGIFFFLKSNWTIALLLPITITQTWRVFSETLRDDYRGRGRISAYQLMAIVALVYSLGWITFIDSGPAASPNILTGLRALVNTPVLLFLEILWICCLSVYGSQFSYSSHTFIPYSARKDLMI